MMELRWTFSMILFGGFNEIFSFPDAAKHSFCYTFYHLELDRNSGLSTSKHSGHHHCNSLIVSINTKFSHTSKGFFLQPTNGQYGTPDELFNSHLVERNILQRGLLCQGIGNTCTFDDTVTQSDLQPKTLSLSCWYTEANITGQQQLNSVEMMDHHCSRVCSIPSQPILFNSENIFPTTFHLENAPLSTSKIRRHSDNIFVAILSTNLLRGILENNFFFVCLCLQVYVTHWSLIRSMKTH